jgi:alpha-aminoadipate carrier protein LysW
LLEPNTASSLFLYQFFNKILGEKKMTTVICVECDGEVELADDVIVGEIVECPDCGVELEVTSVSPLTIELAPEVEEDWGE